MISDIHHTSFTVSDMERSVAFYRDVLGMEVVWDSVQAGMEFKGETADNLTNCPGTELHICFLGINGRLIELVQYTPPGKALADNKASDTGSAHVCFQTEDIEELHKKLSAHKVRLHCAPQNLGGCMGYVFSRSGWHRARGHAGGPPRMKSYG
jgi:catechol 2,3-dioxygenase-like lactoylglutathione lyase family enzyme